MLQNSSKISFFLHKTIVIHVSNIFFMAEKYFVL